MKKTLKLISVAVLAIISVVAMLAFAACKDGDGDTGDNGAEAGYFVIYAELDGTKVGSIDGTQLRANWCVHDNPNACSNPTAFDENGKAKISIAALKNTTGGESFDCHIINLPSGYTYEEGAEKYIVSESTTTVVTITIRHA